MSKGFTLFFAVLVGSLALAVGLAIYDLTIRELDLAATVTQSEYAVYAAVTGLECALFYDHRFHQVVPGDADGTAFATSSDYTHGDIATSGQATCNGQDIVTGTGGPLNVAWSITAPDSTHATTTFEISLSSSSKAAPCAIVQVGKSGNPSNTFIISNGFNTCNTNTLQLERSEQSSPY